MTTSLILVIAGVLCVLGGLAWIFVAKPTPPPQPQQLTATEVDPTKLFELLIELLKQFEKRFLPGIFAMIVGLGLIGFGAWFAGHEAKDAADTAAMVFAGGPLLLGRHKL
jgi:hypothetical protein